MAEAATIVSNWKDASTWSTAQLPAREQFGRWCEFVNEAHLHWSIERSSFDFFPAFIREGRFGDFRTANLTASPQARVKGTRSAAEIAQDDEALYNFLYIAAGSECLTIDGEDIELLPGNLVLWDTTRPMDFVTGTGLHQVTLAVAHSRLHRIFPRASEFVGKPMSCASGLNKLFIDHLLALENQFGDLTKEQAWRVLDTTLNLAVTVLENGTEIVKRNGNCDLLEKIRKYIDENLDDYELCVASIAKKHNISPRHTHRIFGEEGISVSNYITSRRLDRCKIELASPACSENSVTDIAFRWGFNDSSTFSKVFKREFGISPREFRRRNRH